jgi:hypothetical protein
MQTTLSRTALHAAAMGLIAAGSIAAGAQSLVPAPLQAPALESPAPPPTPLEKTSYHVPAFRNAYVTVFLIDIPGGRASDYHVHDHDMTCVSTDEYPPEAYSQPLGGPPGQPRRPPRGEVTYLRYFNQPVTHRAINPGTLAMRSVCAQLVASAPYGFQAEERPTSAYQQLLDNPRVRAWRLILEPGQVAPAITQSAPGMRVVINEGEITEAGADGRERGMRLRQGEFTWQDAGTSRTVRNIGSTRVELVEFEFK